MIKFLILALLLISTSIVQGVEIFSDSFETPIVPPFSNGAPPGWAGVSEAGLANVASIEIRSSQPTYIQISEVVATEIGTGSDLALASAGATASGSGSYSATSQPYQTINGIGPSGYPDIYHSNGASASEFLTITLGSPSTLDSLTIMGRTNCCSDRDVYDVKFYDSGGTLLFSGTGYSADNGAHSVTINFPNAGPSVNGVIHETSGLLTTPFGDQAVWIGSGSVTTTNSNLSEVLIANMIYTLSFNVAKRTDLGGSYNVELIAGSTVLGTVSGTPTQSDFSETDQIIFTAGLGHVNLGEALQIKLSTNGAPQPLFDNISLTAVSDGKLYVNSENIIQGYDVSPYGGGQDKTGTVELRDIGLSLYLEGNRWQKIDFPYTVTANTVIEFDFESTSQGEIHGLGFDNDLLINSNRSFRLYGTQNWGLSNFATYTGGGVSHFSIPVGQYYTGNFQHLFFINDHDVSNPTGNSLFSNIVVKDVSLPVVTDAAGSCMSDSLIVVKYASAANAADMTDLNNYSINNGATITAITAQDNTTAILTIDSLDAALSYTLTVVTQDIPVRLNGALGSYYDQRTGAAKERWNSGGLFGGNRYYSQDPQINFNWGTGTPDAFPLGSGNNDDFSTQWGTYVVPSQTGVYRFRTNSDDGIRVSVNGVSVVDDWSLHGPRVRPTAGNEVPISLDASTPYLLSVEFFERGGGAVAQLQWSVDGGAWEAVPAANFSSCPVIPVGPSSPVLDYRMDEESWSGTDDEITDSSGNDFHGKSGFTTNTVAGKICQAADLSENGTSDYLIMDDSSLNGLSDFSFSVWVNTSKTSGQQEILQALGSNASDDEFELALEGNNSIFIKIQDQSQGFNLSNNEITDGSWKHLLITRSGDTACLYLNGSLKECKNNYPSGALSITSGTMLMGQEQDAFGGGFNRRQDFEGLIDEPLIFSGALTLGEVQAIYNNQNAGNNWDGSARTCLIPPPTTCVVGMLNAVGIKINNTGRNRQINNTTEALAIHAAWLAEGAPPSGLIDGGAYNVAASGSSTADRIDFGGSDHDFVGTLPYPGEGAGVRGSDFLVHTSGSLSLPAGDYTIFVESDDGFSFIMNPLSGDTVTFNKFGSSTGGGSNELRFENPTGNSNTGGSFTLTQDSVFDIAAIFFERGGGDYLEVSIANSIRTNSAPTGYEILREGALGGKVEFICSGGGTCDLGSFAITQDSHGLACPNARAGINIKAMCDDGTTPKTDYAGTINLSSDENTQSDFFLNLNGGSVVNNVVLDGSENGEVNVYLFHKNESHELKVTANDTAAGKSGTAADGTYFGTSGFVISEPTNFVCGDATQFTITAVGEDDSGVSCSTLTGFTGNKALKSWSNINIHPSGNPGPDSPLPKQMVFNSDPIPSSEPSSNNVSAAFSSGVATVTIKYEDVGEILAVNMIHDDFPYDGSSPPLSFLRGSPALFTVYPKPLKVSADSPLSACVDGDETCDAFTSAGESFALTTEAVCLDNTTLAKSYIGTVALGHELVAPLSDGVKGNMLVSAVDITDSDDGKKTISNQQISEVGVFTIKTLQSTYFGQTIMEFTSANIGRFHPHHFDVSISPVGNPPATFSPTCNLDFTYMGQPFEFLTPPEVTIQARNFQDDVTSNYEGGFWKLGSEISENSTCNTNTEGFCYKDTATQSATTIFSGPGDAQNYGITDIDKVNGAVTLSFHNLTTDTFVYQRPNSGLVMPFDADVELTINVSDNDAEGSGILEHIGFTGETDPVRDDQNIYNDKFLRYGRWVLENAFGPETSPLKIPMSAQYYDSTSFVTNAEDGCSTYASGDMEVTPNLKSSGTTSPTGLGTADTGVAALADQIVLSAPGVGHDGTADLCLTVETWLKFDWNNDNFLDTTQSCDASGSAVLGDDPMSIATFGRYRGHDRIIYWREVSN